MLELIPTVVAYLAVLAVAALIIVRVFGQGQRDAVKADSANSIQIRSRIRNGGLTITLIEVKGREFLVVQDPKSLAVSPIEPVNKLSSQ